ASLRGPGGQAGAVPVDRADWIALAAAIDRILTAYGEPDVLVNAAAVNRRPPMDRLTEDDWDVTLAANLTAPFLLGQAFGTRMAARGWGRIINVVSQPAFRAYGTRRAY